MSAVAVETTENASGTPTPAAGDRDRRRFVIAAAVGLFAAFVPVVWVLTDDWWDSFLPLRVLGPANFFDLQAEAIIHGHLWVPQGSLGVEAFVHAHRAYTYFGLLPSLLRIPVLLVDPGTRGHLTVPSMLLAWSVMGVFSCLLIWRTRIVVRGSAVLGWAEAISLGLLVTTIMGGSIVMFIEAAPWVYSEDLAWSMAVAVATLFALVGIVERPSRGRVWAAGALMLAGNLSRQPTAWACVFGAVLIAGRFRLGRGGADNRRWAVPVLAAALVPFAIGCAVNMAKFGVPVGFNFEEQVWTQVNAHRRTFLAVNGGKGYNLSFLPTTLLAYLGPLGIRWQSLFPFVTLPAAPSHLVGHVTFDRVYRTASVPASMPLLFLLSCWAVVTTFRRRAGAGAKLMRTPLLAALAAPGVILLWGYIAPRFEADFMPLLTLGGAIGMIDLFGRFQRRRRGLRLAALSGIAFLACYSMVANLGIAVAPTEGFYYLQAHNYVHAVRTWSGLTGNPLAGQVEQGPVLPPWAPANTIFIVGDCAGLYVSNGEDYSTIPTQQFERFTWDPVEYGPSWYNLMNVTFHGPTSELGAGVPLLTIGGDTVVVEPAGSAKFRVAVKGPHSVISGRTLTEPSLGATKPLVVEADATQRHVVVFYDTTTVALDAPLHDAGAPGGPVVEHALGAAGSGREPAMTVAPVALRPPRLQLCQSLLKDR